jgi:rubrerythrin
MIPQTMNFAADEILEIAIRIERNGVNFYTRAAGIVKDPSHRRLLEDLARMEADHQAIFEAMQGELGPAEREGSQIAADPESAQYLRSVADGHVFDIKVDPSMILTGEETAEEVLSTAIGLEKESVVYYAALGEVVGEGAVRQRVRAIICEELSHIAQLSAQRAALPA